MIALDAALRRLTVCQLTHESRGNGGGLRPSVALRSLPISTGLTNRIIAPASVSAGLRADPRRAWPSMPSSVAMRRRPRLLRPVTFCDPSVYRVGGISSQENKVNSTASIFISSSQALPFLFGLSYNVVATPVQAPQVYGRL